jgi:NitT/TauT family transport system substrate-binding protein
MMRKMLAVLLLVIFTMGGFTYAQEDELPTLKIGVLPVLNTLPLYVAQAEGFYEAEGVQVELINFNSAREQQIAIVAGEIDGLNTDMVVQSLVFKGGTPLVAVRHDTIVGNYFSIVASASSGITSVEDLAGASIGIGENTIIEYLTTNMLNAAGLTTDDVNYEEIPEIPRRVQLMATGELGVATLPEPLTTLVTSLQGGSLILSDESVNFVPTVLAFTQDTLDAQPEAVEAFLRAYENAVNALNADGEPFRPVMLENLIIPEPLQATYPVPSFPTATIPTEAQVGLVVEWMLERGLLDEAIEYSDLVNGMLLPLPSTYDLLAETEQSSAFSQALDAVQSPLVNLGEQFTVFAPDNAAIEGSGEVDLEVLFNHIVVGEYTSAYFVANESGTLTTYNGEEITYEVEDGVVVLNGTANVSLADLDASNGVVHIIDGVLLP